MTKSIYVNFTGNVVGFVLPLLLSSCSFAPMNANQNPPITKHYYFQKTEHNHLAQWSYEGKTGPDYWGLLHPSYRAAIDGKQQSPINIDSSAAVLGKSGRLTFDYHVEQIASFNNGHTIQHNEQPGSYLWINDVRYSLEQLHVHTPSEHTIDGRRFPMEIHFVHQSDQGDPVVVAVLVAANPIGAVDFPAYYELPEHEGEETRFSGKRNAMDYLPRNPAYFEYAGSFTTPPCTEGVRWIVMRESIKVHPTVIQRFKTILKKNYRPLQPLNGRLISRFPVDAPWKVFRE